MFQIATMPSQALKSDSLVLFFDEAFLRKRRKDFSFLLNPLNSILRQIIDLKDFNGTFKEISVFYPAREEVDIERIVLVGTGDEDSLTTENLRVLGYLIAEKHRALSAKRIHLFLGNMCFCREELVQAITEGILYNHYSIPDQKTGKKPKRRKQQFIFVCNKTEYSPRFRKSLIETRQILDNVSFARDLANQPANQLTPLAFLEQIRKFFNNKDNIQIDVLDQDALEAKKLNALLAVNRGSANLPYLIVLKYEPEGGAHKWLGLVGKGVTFDSGGISIKPAARMDEMKYDMAGASAVVGMIAHIAEKRPRLGIIAALPLVENLPDGRAIKPGDVIETYSGKTVEIINTDAEGRLILADALAYLQKNHNPDALIDFATLTGSCLVALGDKRAALFSNSESLKTVLYEAGERSGDSVWPMPLDSVYQKLLESDFADLKNVGGRYGGAITAAKFLENFVGDTPWAHIDIAGTAFNVQNVDYLPNGATGFGVRLFAHALKTLEKAI